MTAPLLEIFYSSVMAPQVSPTVVPTILARARIANAERGITGLLIFDGIRFLQHLEGPHDPLTELMQRIAVDPRHTSVRMIYTGPLLERRYRRFEMGFAEPTEADDVDHLHGLDGEAGLQQFLLLRPQFDIQGG